MTTSVDFAILTDDELHFAFDELIADLAESTGADERRVSHLALMDVTLELGRRTDAWIAGRVPVG